MAPPNWAAPFLYVKSAAILSAALQNNPSAYSLVARKTRPACVGGFGWIPLANPQNWRNIDLIGDPKLNQYSKSNETTDTEDGPKVEEQLAGMAAAKIRGR
ncbi:hypothetical protein [Roseovarius sp. 2305UL8-3]|uniref:hypothetical protein n=1 Tax=Roseovarius conchicola TaxID=3121636 RepID=UPI0035280E88